VFGLSELRDRDRPFVLKYPSARPKFFPILFYELLLEQVIGLNHYFCRCIGVHSLLSIFYFIFPAVKTRFIFLLRLFLLLMSFFIISRGLFLAFQYDQSFNMGWGGFFGAFLYGLRLDLSMTGYVMLLVSLVVAFSGVVPKRIVKPILLVLVSLCLTVFALVVLADAELYRHWGFRMDASVMIYLNTPGEMLASLPVWQTAVFFVAWLAYSGLFVFFYVRWVGSLVNAFNIKHYSSIPVFVAVAAFMVLPIRGSIGIAPINTGMVYFSNDLFHNHSAVNVVWNFMYELFNSERSQLTVRFMSDDDARNIRRAMVPLTDSTNVVLNQNRPNVLFVILEGFSARVIEPLGGRPGVAPCFNKLWGEGIGFSNLYATGIRSDRGLVALLSGYHSHPKASVMKYPKKTERLPSLCRKFNELGYKSSFFYGGDTHFANMNSFIVNSGFQRTVNQDDFPKEFRNSKWGVHDEHMFARVLAETDTATAPFFSVLFTLSSHEPFDVPMDTKIKGNQPAEKYMNSVYYADSCLGAFITEAKKREWWKNTLVVLVADHSVRYPDDLSIVVPQRYTIPMLWLGGAVQKPIVVDVVGGQADIAATLLNQMGIDNNEFYYSNDLLNPLRQPFALYFYNKGFGMVTSNCTVVYNMELDKFSIVEGDTTGTTHAAKALFQDILNDFISL
jgi:phosphoglycerol transferase MdoB-like AlkP superfamily enzyme